MPYVRKGAMGGGFYAIDKELRSRFDEFPTLTADDKFTRNIAKPSERRVVQGCYATVTMPQTFADLHDPDPAHAGIIDCAADADYDAPARTHQ